MQTGQTLGDKVRMLEAGGAVKDAEITRLHAEVARLRTALGVASGALQGLINHDVRPSEVPTTVAAAMAEIRAALRTCSM